MSDAPIEVLTRWLQNLLDPEVVSRVVAPHATYVSLNFHNPELKKILPWAGTSLGSRAFIFNVSAIFRRWQSQDCEVTVMFESGEDVAAFGRLTYRSNTVGKIVTTPFSIHAKVVDGKITYLQFLEDSYATAASFRLWGSWTVQTVTDELPYAV